MSNDFVAPVYRPAAVYRPPKPAPFEFGVDTVTIEELMATPATRQIVLKQASWAGLMFNAKDFQPYISIYTLRDMGTFMPMDVSKSLAAVDAALKTLPVSERPANVR